MQSSTNKNLAQPKTRGVFWYFKWTTRLVIWPVLFWIVLMIIQSPTAFRYKITDWWRLRSYEPSAEIIELANQTTLTDEARKIFYASAPELKDRTTFSNFCQFPELTYVLGCFNGDRIYIFDVENAEIESAEPVTAAHEMLHAVWARMTPDEQKDIAEALRTFYESSKDQSLIEIVSQYEAQPENTKEVIDSELHSIIGTEVMDLPENLEKYYSKHFTDRKAVVRLYDSYKNIFAENEKKIEEIKAKADSLFRSIESQRAALNQKKTDIDSSAAELERLRRSGNASEYNSKVAAHNSAVNEYNSAVRKLQSSINNYNELVEQIEQLSYRQNVLIKALDSSVESL